MSRTLSPFLFCEGRGWTQVEAEAKVRAYVDAQPWAHLGTVGPAIWQRVRDLAGARAGPSEAYLAAFYADVSALSGPLLALFPRSRHY